MESKRLSKIKLNIVFLDSHTTNPGDLDWSMFESLGKFTAYSNVLDPQEIIEKGKDAEILIVNKVKLSGEILTQLPKLKLVCVSATGYNTINIKACNTRGISVCNVKNYSTPAVVQHVYALLLALIHKVSEYSKEVHKGDWSRQPYFSYQNQSWFELKGKTIGIIGFGNIGQRLAKLSIAFGMKVIAYHKHPKRDKMNGVEMVDLDQLFKQSDVISLHVPYNDQTAAMINEKALKAMKTTALLINTGRGGLVQERDLLLALEEGWIAGAGLDVLSNEPPPIDHPLLGVKNCYITPHQAWGSKESRKRLLEGVASNIQAFVDGNPINVVT